MSHLLHALKTKFCVSQMTKPVYRGTGGYPQDNESVNPYQSTVYSHYSLVISVRIG